MIWQGLAAVLTLWLLSILCRGWWLGLRLSRLDDLGIFEQIEIELVETFGFAAKAMAVGTMKLVLKLLDCKRRTHNATRGRMAGTAVLRIVSNRCVPGPMAAGPPGPKSTIKGDEYDRQTETDACRARDRGADGAGRECRGHVHHHRHRGGDGSLLSHRRRDLPAVNRGRSGDEGHGIRCGVESTGGSIYNINAIRGGELDFGVAQSDWQYHAYNGTSRFEEQGPFEGLRAVFSVHPEPFTVVRRADAGIESFDDLLGKRVNVGNPGSGQRGTMEVLMDAKGWTMDDFAVASELQAAEQSQALCDNNIDAMVYTVGHPSGSDPGGDHGLRFGAGGRDRRGGRHAGRREPVLPHRHDPGRPCIAAMTRIPRPLASARPS